MVRPFLLIYLYSKMEVSLTASILIITLAPLSEFIMGLWAGSLADRYGRRPTLIISQIIQSGAMFGYIFSADAWHFAVFTIIYGLGSSLFVPAGNAHISDVVEEEKRGQAFALIQIMLNIGGAIGPLLAILFFNVNPSYVFAMAGVLLAIHCLMIYLFIPESLPRSVKPTLISRKKLFEKFSLKQHSSILWMTVLSIPMVLVIGQMESIFPLYLETKYDNFTEIFGIMLSINATMVVILSIYISKKVENIRSANIILIAYLLFASAGIGYGFASSIALLIIAEIINTIAEMIYVPHINKTVSIIAPEESRGLYFGIFHLQWPIGRTIAPIFGGVILHLASGLTLFLILSVLLVIAGLLWYRFLSRSEIIISKNNSVAKIT